MLDTQVKFRHGSRTDVPEKGEIIGKQCQGDRAAERVGRAVELVKRPSQSRFSRETER